MYQPSRRSKVKDFCPAALIALRLRALFGVSARAEIVRVFLAHPISTYSAANLAPEVGYTKRNVADALENLRMGGLLEVLPAGNQLRYGLKRPVHLLSTIGELPAVFPTWATLLRTLWVINEHALRIELLEPIVAAVEARVALRRMAPDLQLVGVQMPPDAGGEHALPTFERWALELVAGWASGDPAWLTPRDVLRNRPSTAANAGGITGNQAEVGDLQAGRAKRTPILTDSSG